MTDFVRRWWMITPAILIVTVGLVSAYEFWQWDVSWQNSLIHSGEYWRIFTGHWQHLGWNHWWMNALGIVLILWLLPELLYRMRWLLGIFLGSIVISLGLMLTPLQGYVGFSGILYVWFFQGLLVDKTLTLPIKLALMSMVVLKMLMEQLWPDINDSTADYIGGSVAIDAHVLGSMAGVVLAVLDKFLFHRFRE
jgi:rhomboid family GlyGly-CTERM serine protease